MAKQQHAAPTIPKSGFDFFQKLKKNNHRDWFNAHKTIYQQELELVEVFAEALLRELFARVVDDLGLKVIDSVWKKFSGEGGVTGLIALTESHLACHTYPEHNVATFNLYCCRTRPEWDWEANLTKALGEMKAARTVTGLP